MVGDSAAGHVETLRLPRSGWLLQWRSDGLWRELNDAQYRAELDGSHLPAEDEWVRWSGTYQPQARGGGRWDGAPTWWFVFGELTGPATPSVVLADGKRPTVLLLGRVWACEWFSEAQSATLEVDGVQLRLPLGEPEYRRFID